MSDSLKLLVPWQLPPLSESLLTHQDRDFLEVALSELRSILCQSVKTDDRLIRLEAFLAQFPAFDYDVTKTCEQSLLSDRSLEVYDNYFEIDHIETPQPPLAILASIAHCALAFSQLQVSDSDSIKSEDIETQETGFRAYLDLFERIYLSHS